MSQMLAEISRIVNEDISSRVTQYDVLFEAITNSVHSNSTIIKCYLNSNDNLLKENEKEIGTVKLDSIKIVDNGDGLTDENYKSFSKYRSQHKKALGCKGVGRFVFLKIYKSVNYVSQLNSIQERRDILFDFNFDTDDLKSRPVKITKNETTISLLNLTKEYYNLDKKLDRRIALDIAVIRDKVLTNLFPTLFFYKQKGVDVTIVFFNEHNSTSLKITPDDIPDFIKTTFEISNGNGEKHKFYLHHKIEKEPGDLKAFYCGNNRTVCDFETKDLKINLPYDYSGFMLLESEYFDKRVNNERNDFDVFPVRTDAFSTLSWEMINSDLKIEIGKIVKEGIPNTKKINKAKLKEIQDERPYLVQYIDTNDIEMAGFLDKRQIIDKAKKQFDIAKEKILVNSNKKEFTDKDLNSAIQLAQNELVSYINDRVIIINQLKAMIDKNERVEEIIHNLFMQKYTESNYSTVMNNNLWLLDDRFTTYSYAASDKRIVDVIKGIDESTGDIEILGDKPDLSLFFSHNPKDSERLKAVLIELKPFDFASKSDRKKFNGIQQLIDYVKAFKSREKVDEVYGYLITDVDDKLSTRLTDNGFTPLFSQESPIYYNYYDKIGVSIFVVGAKTLVADAEARNKTFLNIIKKQSKISSFLKD